MLSTLSTLTNDPLSLWEWTVPDEGYCTGSTAPGESQFTNMKRKSRKNGKYFQKYYNCTWWVTILYFHKMIPKEMSQMLQIFRFPIAPDIPVT